MVGDDGKASISSFQHLSVRHWLYNVKATFLPFMNYLIL